MRQQLPGGVGLDDRMPSGSREPKGRPKKETRDVMTVSLHNPARTYDTTSHHPVTAAAKRTLASTPARLRWMHGTAGHNAEAAEWKTIRTWPSGHVRVMRSQRRHPFYFCNLRYWLKKEGLPLPSPVNIHCQNG